MVAVRIKIVLTRLNSIRNRFEDILQLIFSYSGKELNHRKRTIINSGVLILISVTV